MERPRSVIGSITGDWGGGVSYNTTSDRRLKTEITDYTEGLQLAMQMRPTMYEMKSAPGRKEVGLIAQELQHVFPQAVSGTPDSPVEKPMSIDYSRLTPVLLSAFQELKAENDRLNAELQEVKKTQQGMIEALQTQYAELSARIGQVEQNNE